MQITKIKSNSHFPIIVEDYPKDYDGCPFITLIKYNDEINLSIIDNVTKRHISAYCLDLCHPQQISELDIIKIANEWYHTNKENYPISIEFCKKGVEFITSKIIKAYSIDYVSRLIGPVFVFEMNNPVKTRKRKRKIPKEKATFQKNVVDFTKTIDYYS